MDNVFLQFINKKGDRWSSFFLLFFKCRYDEFACFNFMLVPMLLQAIAFYKDHDKHRLI